MPELEALLNMQDLTAIDKGYLYGPAEQGLSLVSSVPKRVENYSGSALTSSHYIDDSVNGTIQVKQPGTYLVLSRVIVSETTAQKNFNFNMYMNINGTRYLMDSDYVGTAKGNFITLGGVLIADDVLIDQIACIDIESVDKNIIVDIVDTSFFLRRIQI